MMKPRETRRSKKSGTQVMYQYRGASPRMVALRNLSGHASHVAARPGAHGQGTLTTDLVCRLPVIGDRARSWPWVIILIIHGNPARRLFHEKHPADRVRPRRRLELGPLAHGRQHCFVWPE